MTDIETHLNKTKKSHNRLGYNDFQQRLEIGLSKVRIAEDFGVSVRTIFSWLKLKGGK